MLARQAREFCATAALRCRIGEPRAQVSLRFQPIERDVDRSARHIAAGAPQNLVPNGHRVGIVAQPQHREQHDLLELAK